MKLALLSDLHLSVHPFDPPAADADVWIVPGDLARPAEAIAWVRQPGKPAVFVAGNHEFYGTTLVEGLARLRELARGTAIQVLERDEWHYGHVRFLGCTLWSDFLLYDSPQAREAGLAQSTTQVRDFSRIGIAPDFPEKFTPALSHLLFAQSVDWLESRFAQPHDGPTVVVTHHAPSLGSIHPRFAGSPLNACFVSDLDEQIRRWRPLLWLHGHVHDSCDYRVGATRIIANPRGYAPKGVVENPCFDPTLVIDLDRELAERG